jgi:type 2 lantibiotic biosynthesis protein LanM
MSLAAPLPFEDVLRVLGDGPLELLSQICSGPLLAAFTIFRDSDARRFQASGDEIYRDFCVLLQRGGLPEFFLEFPELARVVNLCIGDWREASREFFIRLNADFPHETIVHLEPSLSDRHGGRTVLGVTFASGLRLAYKPRDMALERCYFELLEWLNTQGAPVAQRILQVIEGRGYGWAEWVENEPCDDENDVRDYFTRAGALQCLFYVLHATDAHMGNVLAAGGYPVLVDAECLLQPRRFDGKGDVEQEALEDLLGAGFLPRPKIVSGGAADFSGLGGDGGESTEFRVPIWSAVNTDAMSFRFVPGVLLPQNNAPVLGGARAEVRNYSAEFLGGFEKLYRFLMDRRSLMLASGGPLEAMFSAQARVLLRSTREYVSILNRSLHPRYLRDGERRAEMLREWVGRDSLALSSEILDKEAEALGDLNVPYFSAAADQVTLQAQGGVSLPGYFHAAGREVVTGRMREMDEAGLEHQLGLLKSLLTLLSLSV